ncbi:MAG: DEAD/DEAH box helicase [Rhodothermales bacterium]
MSEADTTATTEITSFHDLNLPPALLKAVDEVGYETPSAIQAQAIPILMEGLDLIGRAPTGTGKTAAFALPLLSRVALGKPEIQILILTPTRELAIQVAEALQRYASYLKGFKVLPVYGGQAYGGQIRQLKRGVHAIVGTPGRLMDHMRKGTLKLDSLQVLVLDEADEMLRMGFIDDVEWILEQAPKERQMALFSATMPKEIKRIAQRYLSDAREIAIKTKAATAETIRQRYWVVSGVHKLDALTRILEVETFDAILMFVRTKVATVQLADKLEARGFAAAALNGDMAQNQREQMVNRLKKGSLDILVATDVAARGLDVDRISHVINYDIPNGTEAYVHRIGRTGRAGRQGDAILFVSPRERSMLRAIEKMTRQKIELMTLPTNETINNKRISDFKQKITDTLAAGKLEFMQGVIQQYQQEHDVPAIEIAAALANMALRGKDLQLKEREKRSERLSESKSDRGSRDKRNSRKTERGKEGGKEREGRKKHDTPSRPPKGMERFRVEVGRKHDVKPGNIVGAIANETGIDSEYIGHIDIQDDFSYVDLPSGMPHDVFKILKKAWVCGQCLNISQANKAPKEYKKGHKSKNGKKRKRF